jgi:carnitine 3-dehydrogenase
VATVESLLLHVDLGTRKTCLPGEDVARALARITEEQAGLPVPDGAGKVGR